MKKLILSTLALFICLFSFAQDIYKAYATEFYTYDKVSKEWTLYEKNSDVNIRIVVEESFVTIQAKSPSMYKINQSSKEDINTENFFGYRYLAKDLKEDIYVTIDIIRYKYEKAMISIMNTTQGYQIVFYITQ